MSAVNKNSYESLEQQDKDFEQTSCPTHYPAIGLSAANDPIHSSIRDIEAQQKILDMMSDIDISVPYLKDNNDGIPMESASGSMKQQQQQQIVNSMKNPDEISLGIDAGSLKNISKKGIFEHKTPRDIKWEKIDFRIGKKIILNECWGEVKSGSVCAVLGPSGSGKTSLLNVLAGRISSSGNVEVSGRVNVGGEDIDPVMYRQNIAYVAQEDALLLTATPREAMEFSASLRFHHSITQTEVKNHVQGLLEELGLLECADTIIGGNLITGLSGGEKKRVSIGIELISDPHLVFLDEPTSGLDSFTALHLIHLLKKVATYETTILLTIHQPSSEIFRQFDHIMYLNDARVFYQGTFQQLLSHFTPFGYECPSNHNPADFIMSICQRETPAELEKKGLFSMVNAPPLFFSTSSTKVKLNTNKSFQFQSGMMKQLKHLVIRELTYTMRDTNILKLRFGLGIFLNVLIGIVFLNVGDKDNSVPANLTTHFAAMTILTMTSMQRTVQAVIITFPYERPLFLREFSTGTYYVLSYFISKSLIEIPLTWIITVVKTIPFYYMVNMQGDFMTIIWIVFGISIEASSVAIFLGCTVSTIKKAFELVPLIFIPQMLFVGFFRRLEDIPVFLRWAQYLCGLKYAVNLVLLTEFSSHLASCHGKASRACSAILSNNNIEVSNTWLYAFLLVVLSVVFRVVGGVTLMKKALKYY